jgi:hypothetical protein
MTVLTPDLGLLLWTIMILFHIALMVTAARQLFSIASLGFKTKLIWLSFMCLVPVIGPVLFFLFRNQVKRIRLFLYNT